MYLASDGLANVKSVQIVRSEQGVLTYLSSSIGRHFDGFVSVSRLQ